MGHWEYFLTPYIVVLHFEQRANKAISMHDEDSNSETETNINPLYEVENKIIPIQNESVLDNYIFCPLISSQ
ncbi:13985_t:CDS:2, partial [Funneliformis geosporum]